MPMYANKEYDYLYDELSEFLESHNPSELLNIASNAVSDWEYKKDKESKLPNAIPIEWLEKKIEKCKSSKDLYPQLFEEIMTIVIAEWRKENETN
jgi:hypothetical protein